MQLYYPQMVYGVVDGVVIDEMNRGEGAALGHNFPGVRSINVRYWVMLSADWVSSNISSKLLYGPRSNDGGPLQSGPGAGQPAGPGCIAVMVGSNNPYVTCQQSNYDSPWGFYGVKYNEAGGFSEGPALRRGQWECIEYHLALGTLGNFDGRMTYYLNDTTIEDRQGLPLYNDSNVGTFGNIEFYQERGRGRIWYDDIVITDGTRIGCSGGPPPTNPDNPVGPPGQVTGLTVTVQ
jgi:hypothetical protein